MTEEERAKDLRNQGFSYEKIARDMGFPCAASAWHLCNRERSRKNARESTKRYYRRGCVALYDMRDKK